MLISFVQGCCSLQASAKLLLVVQLVCLNSAAVSHQLCGLCCQLLQGKWDYWETKGLAGVLHTGQHCDSCGQKHKQAHQMGWVGGHTWVKDPSACSIIPHTLYKPKQKAVLARHYTSEQPAAWSGAV